MNVELNHKRIKSSTRIVPNILSHPLGKYNWQHQLVDLGFSLSDAVVTSILNPTSLPLISNNHHRTFPIELMHVSKYFPMCSHTNQKGHEFAVLAFKPTALTIIHANK